MSELELAEQALDALLKHGLEGYFQMRRHERAEAIKRKAFLEKMEHLRTQARRAAKAREIMANYNDLNKLWTTAENHGWQTTGLRPEWTTISATATTTATGQWQTVSVPITTANGTANVVTGVSWGQR